MAIQRSEPWILLAVGALALILSAIQPHDYLTWVLEVFPILVGVPILILSGRRFPLTPYPTAWCSSTL